MNDFHPCAPFAARPLPASAAGRARKKPFYYLLEDAGIKLSAVASDITGVSGRAMLQALIDGQRDPAVLAGLAKRRLRAKIRELTDALTGRFTDHHAFLTRVHLELTDRHTAAVDQITTRIDGAPCAVLVVPDIDPRRKPP